MKMIRKTFILLLGLIASLSYGQKQLYELRVYDVTWGKDVSILHQYLENALIPALNRHEVGEIGAFEETSETLPQKLYLLIPYNSMDHYQQVLQQLKTDRELQEAARAYYEYAEADFPISGYTSSLLVAFEGLPALVKPAQGSQLFELRTYEAYNEDALRRKIKMFNESEFEIFDEVGLHSVFFGEQISGPEMPCLVYMLAFRDMEERNANWAKFFAHPEWQRILELEEYAHTVSNISRVFLRPLSYSQF